MSLEKVLERLAAVTGAHNDAELARALNSSRQSLSKWRSRGSIPYEKLHSFAEENGASLDYLLLGKEVDGGGNGGIDKAVFDEVWAALKSDRSEMRALSSDALLPQAVHIYNQAIHVQDDAARARVVDGAIMLLNSLQLSHGAENMRRFAESQPDAATSREMSAKANALDAASEEQARKAEKAAGGTKASQTIHGNVGQVGGGDINNNFGDKDK